MFGSTVLDLPYCIYVKIITVVTVPLRFVGPEFYDSYLLPGYKLSSLLSALQLFLNINKEPPTMYTHIIFGVTKLALKSGISAAIGH
uniref:Uncharacterized protein n=1 Tax=Arion vulgaris TaxID=1028688 RepID=A0A0B7BUE1_9EUPU